MQKTVQRWYDKKEIGKYIDAMRFLSNSDREPILVGIRNIIAERNPNIMVDHVLEFQLYKNRWYDKDPYCWLVINSLKYVDDFVMEKILLYLNTIETKYFQDIKKGA